MKMRKIGETCYFIKGNHFGKCYIDKLIIIKTAKETLTQYEIRPYGLNKPIQIHTENLYDSFEIAKKEVLHMLKDSYEKQVEAVANDKEAKFDEWENNYQESLKTDINVE